MKLFLMRHAHTEDAKNIEDILRNLTDLGQSEALDAADFLSNYNIDKILLSPAARTRQTVDILQTKLQCKKCETIPELYGSSLVTIIDIIAKQDDKDQAILIVAHNPGIFKAALFLIDDDNEYEALLENGMNTAKIVTIDFQDMKSWIEIKSRGIK